MEVGSSFNDKEHPDKTNGSIWPFEFSRLLELQLLLRSRDSKSKQNRIFCQKGCRKNINRKNHDFNALGYNGGLVLGLRLRRRPLRLAD
jgi:hypothetical protein